MKRAAGRTMKNRRIPCAGLRAFFLSALLLNLFLCVSLSAQAVNLPLPYPIPPPAEDPPPAERKPASATQSVQQKPAVSSPANTAAADSAIRVSPKPLRDISGNIIPMNGLFGGGSILLPAAYSSKQNEFRGGWVTTVYNLDFAKHTTAAEFQQSFRTLAAKVASLGFNTILFQVRPN